MASIKLQGDNSGTLTIQAPSDAGNHTLTLPASTQTLATQNALGVRNLIINGDMRIAQRSTNLEDITATGYYTVDRFLMNIDAGNYSAVGTMQQNLDSLTPPADFTNYVGIKINTGVTPVEAAYYNFRQIIEGYNTAHLMWGTSNAKTITVSFWVRSSLTGTFVFTLRNGSSDRSYVTTYTIDTADTWEKKTITISGDTTGTWLIDNGIGLTVNWGHGAANPGQYTTSTLNEWIDGSFTGYTGQTNIIETTQARWYITGVQLEVGTEATPFEHRPYDMELARCLRYYFYDSPVRIKTYSVSASNNSVSRYNFPAPMRTTPAITITTGTTSNLNYVTALQITNYGTSITLIALSAGTVSMGDSSDGALTFSAEF